jgi:3-hydroxy-9,10-secoandrosta-1,3,5(10)-triene-9,17-dione monooxygenase
MMQKLVFSEIRPLPMNKPLPISSGANLPESASDLIDRVKRVIPLIAENAVKAEQDRKPVDRVIRALEETGVFKSLVPKRYGGYELDTQSMIDIGIAVSEACTSTGWVATFYMEHNWMLAQFPEKTQDEIFGAQPYILAPASISPNGKAERVDGGFKITGRWAWGTGVMHADWAFLNGIVQGDKPEPRLFIVPVADIRIEDTWYCSGMQGTGSNDMVVTELFVPEARSESLIAMSLGRGSGVMANNSPRFKHPMVPLLSVAAACPAIGAAKVALASFQERLGGRAMYGTLTKQAERPSAQILLGNASVKIQAAEIILRKAAEQIDSWGYSEEICPPEERARLRLHIASAVHMCKEVVQELMKMSGAGAHMKSHAMQRVLRDINTLSCHTVFDMDTSGENYGRLVLGMDPASPV